RLCRSGEGSPGGRRAGDREPAQPDCRPAVRHGRRPRAGAREGARGCVRIRRPRRRAGVHGEGVMKKRAPITGVGVISPVGIGAETFWEGLQNGRSGIDAIRRYDASALPVRISAEVRGFRLEDYVDTLPSYTAHDGCRAALDLRTQYALAAAEMCVR